jgi:UDPglucose--hexose-1-phosphate uridylyltransferase
MPELRRDPVTGRWVIIAADRQKRPSDFRFDRPAILGREQCPFCPGRESLTPPEILSYRQNGGGPNSPGWDIRVVPNKFPALQVEGNLDRVGDGMFDRMGGVGAHEVIIETPDHGRTLAWMSEPEIERVLWAYRERMLDLKRDIRMQYILVFKNHGAAAGATLEHTHSQLIALPIVPDFVREEVEGARRHFAVKERCVFCDIIHQDTADGKRVVFENADIVALAPYAPRLAFETWLMPRRHGARFEDAPRNELESLARALKTVLQRMDRAPRRRPTIWSSTRCRSSRTRSRSITGTSRSSEADAGGGFRVGDGFYINPTAPKRPPASCAPCGFDATVEVRARE